MIYRFKYKLVKNILSQYFDLKELNFNVANENTFINVVTNDKIFFSLYVNEHEDDFKFNGDEKLVDYLTLLENIFNIAKTTDYLSYGDEITLSDNNVIIHITKLVVFGFPVLLFGDEDYILAIPLSDDFNNENTEDIVIALLNYSENRAFPEKDFRLFVNENIFSRFPDELKELEFLEIKNRG